MLSCYVSGAKCQWALHKLLFAHRFEDRDLPPPPPEEARVPPISAHHDDERLPPPPPSDYVNYQANGPRSFANDPNQHRLARYG